MKLQRYTLYLVGSIILANYTFGIFTVSADNLSTVQTRVNQIQATDPLLPSGVTEQKGMFGTIIAALFDTAGKIRVEFLGNLVPGITSNNVPKWNGTNFVNSSISDDGTNINLTRSLITNSSMKINGWLPLYFQGTSLYGQDNGLYFYSDHPNSTFMRFYDRNGVRYGAVYGGGTGAYFGIEDGDGDRSYLAAKNSYTDFRINNSSIMRFLYPSGNVGIGTTSPSYRLDVAGTIHTNGDLMANRICNADGSSCNTFPLATGGGYWTVSGNNIYNNNSGNVGIGNSSPNAKLDVAGGVIANAVSTTCIGNCSVATAATAPALSGNYGVNGDMYVTGNFGVGTSTPSYKMEVNGSLKANNYVWKNGVNWSMPDDNSEMSFDFANASGNAYWQVRDPTHGTILSARNNGNVGVGTASPSQKLTIQDGNLTVRSTWPTIFMRDTDNRSAMIHTNSNYFYVLRGSGNDSETRSQYNGRWPLVLNLENNDITLGGAALIRNNLSVCNGNDTYCYLRFSDDGYIQDFNDGWLRFYGNYMFMSNLYMATRTDDCPAGWTCNGRFWDISAASLYVSGIAYRSDERLKEDIVDVSQSDSENFMKLRPISFYWRDKKMNGSDIKYGVIAQEVEKVFPKLVRTADDKMQTKSVDYDSLFSIGLKVTQENSLKINNLEKENDLLKQRLNDLEQKLLELKK